MGKKIDPATAAFLPPDIPGRLAYVGVTLYGICWRARLAAGLGIGRTTLHQWMTDGKRDKDRDIDAEIADLIDRERDLSAERSVALTTLHNRFLRVKKASSMTCITRIRIKSGAAAGKLLWSPASANVSASFSSWTPAPRSRRWPGSWTAASRRSRPRPAA